MLKTWILVFLFFNFVVAEAFAEKVQQIQWQEHLGLCRSPTSYQTKKYVKTAKNCMDICDKDSRCLMVKYSKRARTCWLCDNKSLAPSVKCFLKHDFYIKVFPAPNAVSWTEEQGSCMADKPYKIWFIETANECKTTCAEESKCKMVKYSPQERKCYFSFSSELTPYKKCMVKYDFYTKVLKTPETEWIEQFEVCQNASAYEVITAHTAKQCKSACTKDQKCSMVKYHSKDSKCWKSSSLKMQHSGIECAVKYDFYQKDKCAGIKKRCSGEELCMNNGKDFTCLVECPVGYFEGMNQACEDVNECEDNPRLCGKDAECFNSPGSVTCVCHKSGFVWKKGGCTDDDECQKDICGEYADCRNTIGGYKCSCNPGFKKLEENVCVDLDECAAETGLCSKNSFCVNTIGSYSCQCINGDEVCEDDESPVDGTKNPLTTAFFDKENEHTEEATKKTIKTTTIMMTSKPPTTIAATEIPESVLREPWISHPKLCFIVQHYEVIREINTERECRWHCEQQKKCLLVQYDSDAGECWLCDNRQMEPKTECKKTFDYYVKGRNECEGKRGKCHRNAVCKTSKGHRVCQCVYGFKGDGWNCKDINECSYYKDLCGTNAKCVNKIGSYSCKCKRGFKREDGRCQKKGRSALSKPKYDYIREWKREHESDTATSICAIPTLTAILTVLFHQFFSL